MDPGLKKARWGNRLGHPVHTAVLGPLLGQTGEYKYILQPLLNWVRL